MRPGAAVVMVVGMERAAWLGEKRRLAEERYDALFAPGYDERWGELPPTHRRFLERFLALCPPGGKILDAACGTGRPWPLVLERGMSLVGTDQSAEMLGRAREKFPGVPTRKVGLQELDYEGGFDGALCLDSMENVPPEDWSPVLDNLARSLKPGGLLYFTTELEDEGELAAAYVAGRERGLPLVEGEHPFVRDPRAGEVSEGGYHYYPPIRWVEERSREAGFIPIEEAEGDGLHHLLARKASWAVGS